MTLGSRKRCLIQVMEGNQSCIKLSQSEKMNTHTKHIGMRCHLVCDLTEKGVTELVYSPNTEVMAGILIECLPRVHFQNLCDKMDLQEGRSIQV